MRLVRRACGAILALVMLAGCGTSDPQADPRPVSSSTPSATPSGTPSAAPNGTPSPAPDQRVGTCLGPKPGKPTTKVPVPCTQPHELEIVGLLRTTASSYTVAHSEAEQTCRTAGATYLGSPHHASTRLRVNPAMPPRESWAKGRRGGSCLVEIHTADLRSFASQRGSVRNALAGEGLHRYRLCGVGKANAAGRLVHTSCDRPHRSEALPTSIVLGVATDRYPGRQTLNRRTGPQCRTALRAFLGTSRFRADIQAGWRMPTQTQWADGSRTATCYADLNRPLRHTVRALR